MSYLEIETKKYIERIRGFEITFAAKYLREEYKANRLSKQAYDWLEENLEDIL